MPTTTPTKTTEVVNKIYTEEEQLIIDRMDEAAKEDRGRFFVVADAMTMQPKYKDMSAELEAVKQEWRDMTTLAGYPEIKWPMTLPEWFPEIKFASNWDVDYLTTTMARQTEMAEHLNHRPEDITE